MNDSVLIERLEPIEQQRGSSIIITDMATADAKMLIRKGRVLAVGPGKWIEGTWWQFQTPKPHWEWIPGHRQQMEVKVGQEVLFNARWNDLASRDFYNKLPNGIDPLIHLITEGDITGVIA